MEFKSEEFLKNIEIEKEKVELKKQAQHLESQKNESVIKNRFNNNSFQTGSTNNFNDDSVVVDIKGSFEDELDDIKLTNNSMNSETKKKYIILSISLSILFILTIVIIRLVSDDTKENSLFTTSVTEQIKQDKILDTPDANEKYDALIKQKAKQTIQKELNLKSIAKEEIPLPIVEEKVDTKKQTQESTNDIFGMEKKPQEKVETEVNKPVVTKKLVQTPIKIKETVEIPKKIQKKEIVKEVKKPARLVGNFIQIGAFTKAPNKILLKLITEEGYTYKLHKMVIKGTTYNKVLIGPYKGERASQIARDKIRKDLNKPQAYILRLK